MAKRKKSAKDLTGAIYARYSSHAQKDASIEQQVSECMEYAKAHKITVLEIYDDRAISGRTDKRPNFQRMLKDAEAGKFQCVIAWKSNRMGRNMMQAMVNEARLQDAGVKCFYVEEDFDDSAAGRFALRSMMNVNQFYSENMAEDIVRGMRDNAEKCLVTNGHVPFGYRRTSDLHYELDPPNDDIVREVFRRVADGEPLMDIARDLNERGIKTSTGSKWSRSSFSILSNERYTGVYIYDDIRIENGIPRIVSDELFWRVQTAMKNKKNPRNRGRHRATGEDYLLTGKLFCGLCGSPMTGISGTGKSGVLYHYYVCQKRRTERACNKSNVRRDAIETAIARAIQIYALRQDVIEWIADTTVEYFEHKMESSQVSVLERELADTQKSIKNLLKAIEAGIITPTTKDRMMELEKEQEELRHKIAAAKDEVIEIDRDTIIEGLGMFQGGNVEDKKYRAALFNTFLLAVYVYEDTLKIIFTFNGDKNNVEIPFDFGDLAKNGAVSEKNTDAEPKNSASASSFDLSSVSNENVRLTDSQGHHTKVRPNKAILLVGRTFLLGYRPNLFGGYRPQAPVFFFLKEKEAKRTLNSPLDYYRQKSGMGSAG